MYAQVEKSKVNKSRAVANSDAQKKGNSKQGFGFVDNRQDTKMIQRYVPPHLISDVMLPTLDLHDLIQNRLKNRTFLRIIDKHVKKLIDEATDIHGYLRLLEQFHDVDVGHLYYIEVMNRIRPLLEGLDRNLLNDFHNSLPNSALYNDLRIEIGKEIFRGFGWTNPDFDND